MLTTAGARAARPCPRVYKRTDAAGLFLEIRPTGTKSWRDSHGREQLLTFGTFPEVSLDAARTRRDAARAAIAAGLDPRAPANDDVMTFKAAARAWHSHRAPAWSPVHAGDVLISLQRDVFPAIGAVPLDQLTRPVVLQLL